MPATKTISKRSTIVAKSRARNLKKTETRTKPVVVTTTTTGTITLAEYNARKARYHLVKFDNATYRKRIELLKTAIAGETVQVSLDQCNRQLNMFLACEFQRTKEEELCALCYTNSYSDVLGMPVFQ